MKNGRWVFAGDFSGQAIFAAGADEHTLLSRLNKRGIQQATFTLSENCRNAKRVATNISILGGLSPGYSDILHSHLEGLVKPHFVGGTAEAKENKLREVLADLRKRFAPEQIVVLSPLAVGSIASGLAARDVQIGLTPLGTDGPVGGYIGYCTIHAFKGLDAQVVVITDIAGFGGQAQDTLFYTGLSRGRQEVHLILDTALKRAYQERVMAGVGARY